MTVTFMKSGEKVRYAGSVIRHERPETARGVVFMTLEDEASFVNAAVWESVLSTTYFVKNGTGVSWELPGIVKVKIMSFTWSRKTMKTEGELEAECCT